MNPYNGNGSIFNANQAGLPTSAFLEGFLETAINAFIGLDAQGKIVYWNPAAEQLYGWSASEALGKSVLELLWPEGASENQEAQRKWFKELQRGETIHGEYSPCHKNGSLIVGEYSARSIFNEKGEISGSVIISRDISERLQTDEEIRNLNAELKANLDEINTLLEMLPIGIWIGNQDCSIITGNSVAYKIFGLAEGTNVSVSNPEMPLGLRIFVDGVEVPPEDAPMQRVARTGKPMLNFENELLFADQTRKTIYTSVVPIFDRQGALLKVIAAFADFTERKLAEEQLRFAHKHVQQTADRIARLQKVTEALSRALTPMEVSEALIQMGAPALGAVSGTIMLLSEDGQWLETIHSGTPEEIVRPYRRFPVSMHVPAADAIRSGQPVWIESQQQYLERYPQIADQILAWGNQTAVAIPIGEKERPLGVLTLSFEECVPNTPENLGFAQNLAQQGAQALERARLYQAEQSARLAAERAADRMTRLQQITAALTGLGTKGQLAQAVVQLSIMATGANAGLLVECPEDGQELKVTAAHGYPLAAMPTGPIALSEHMPISDSVRTGRAMWIGSQEELAALYPSLAERWDVFYNQATAAIPLIIRERVLGGLAFSFAERRGFDQGEREFLLAVAQECAQGLERTRAEGALRESEKQLQSLNESLEQKVKEQTAEVRKLASDLTKAEQRERHRISHILHEDLQQRIYAIQMQLEFSLTGIESNKESFQLEFDRIRKQLREVLLLTRQLSVDLSPQILRDEGLTQAVEWLASQMSEQHGLEIELKAKGTFSIHDEDLHMLLFSSIRELLFNVIKHSSVDRAVVEIQKENGDLHIVVRDEGRGFNVDALSWNTNGHGPEGELQYLKFGLPTLRHRLNLFGGNMEVQSAPGEGTTVTVTIPLPE